MGDSAIIDPFFRALASEIREELSQRMAALARGSATKITEDQVSTAEKYAAQVSYIAALNHVIEMGEAIQKRQMGLKE